MILLYKCGYCGESKERTGFRKTSFDTPREFCNSCRTNIYGTNQELLKSERKICLGCGEEKDFVDFSKCSKTKDGLKSKCKECLSKEATEHYYKTHEHQLEVGRKYREEHREEINAKARENYDPEKNHKYYEEHKEEILASQRIKRDENKDEINRKNREQYNNDPEYKSKVNERNHEWYHNGGGKEKMAVSGKNRYEENKEEILKTNKEYRDTNKDKINARRRESNTREKKDKRNEYLRGYYSIPENKIAKNLRNRLRMALKQNQKRGSAVKDLGCSIEDLKTYLEDQFYPNPKTGEVMSWENYGRKGWHIDHITPLCQFDLKDRAQTKKACHYTNLQPLWFCDNIEKRNKDLGWN